VSAQDKPNFAGKWKADNGYNVWTITVEGSRMTVTMTVAGNSGSTVYLLDGTPSTKTFEGARARAGVEEGRVGRRAARPSAHIRMVSDSYQGLAGSYSFDRIPSPHVGVQRAGVT
jgi:hypothetical protein